LAQQSLGAAKSWRGKVLARQSLGARTTLPEPHFFVATRIDRIGRTLLKGQRRAKSRAAAASSLA